MSSSVSVADVLLGAVQQAVRDGVGELSRAEGKRGIVHLDIELCLGDDGVPLWLKPRLYFQPQLHHKDR